MMHADLADTALASYRPDMAAACDSILDIWCEALAPFIAREKQSAAFAMVAALLEESAGGGRALDREQIATGLLRAIYGDTSHAPEIRIIAAAALKRFGKDGRSYQAMGDEFGVTRACVHAHSRRIERRTGLKCRADKKESARTISAEKASGRRRSHAPIRGSRAPAAVRCGFSILRLHGI